MKLNLRHALIAFIPWLCCTMQIAAVYGILASMIYKQPNSLYSILLGLSCFIPFVLIDIACKKIKYMWLYLLCIAAICTLYFLFVRCYILVPLMAILGLIRMSGRLSEDQKDTVLDNPHWVGAVLFALTFICSAVLSLPFVQLFSLCAGAVYLILCFAMSSLKSLENYVKINGNMANFPKRRISKRGNIVIVGAMVLAIAILLPSAIMNYRFLKIDPDSWATKSVKPPADMGWTQSYTEDPLGEWMMAQAKHTETSVIAEILGVIFMWAGILLAIGIIVLFVYNTAKNFRGSLKEKNDTIESTLELDEKERVGPEKKKERLSMLDFSPNAQVRRRYIRTVKGQKKALPEIWQSPMEIEQQLGIQDDKLHGLYEKARYSEGGVSHSELK